MKTINKNRRQSFCSLYKAKAQKGKKGWQKLIEKGRTLIEKQINMQATLSVSDELSRKDENVSPDIIRLLDLLARIEVRRQIRQRSADKNKVS